MLLGGLRRCEVLGAAPARRAPGEKRPFIAEGKGGHQRIVPVSPRFSTTPCPDYLDLERPRTSATDRLFVVLKGQRRGRPLTVAGLDEIIAGARDRLSTHPTPIKGLRSAGDMVNRSGAVSAAPTCPTRVPVITGLLWRRYGSLRKGWH